MNKKESIPTWFLTWLYPDSNVLLIDIQLRMWTWLVSEKKLKKQTIWKSKEMHIQQTETKSTSEPFQQSNEQHELFYKDNYICQRCCHPPPMQYESWLILRIVLIDPRNRKMIFHSCYRNEHNSPQCTLKLHQLYHVVKNSQWVTADEKPKLKEPLYDNTKAYL